MPFTIGWYDAGMLIDCTDTLDTGARQRLLKVVEAAFDTCVCLTDIILDWRGSRGNPMQRHQYTDQVAALVHPKLGMVAAVDSGPGVDIRADRRYEGQDFAYLACTSLEEAVLLLKQRTAPIHQATSPCPECP